MRVFRTYTIAPYRKLTVLFIFLTLVYVGLVFFIPPDKTLLTRFQLSIAEINMLRAATVLPYIIIWFVALYGYIRFNEYAHKLRDSREGSSFRWIAKGLLVLALMQPFTTILNNFSSFVYKSYPATKPTLVILTNYIGVILLLVALYLLYRGAHRLKNTLQDKASYWRYKAGVAGLIVLAVLYVLLTIQTLGQTPEASHTLGRSYYLPALILITTVVIPHLIAWYLGALAAFRIGMYSTQVKGILYRQAIRYLARGIILIIASQIAVRYVVASISWLNNLSLTYLVAVIYVLLFLIGIGFGLIAVGARRLQKMEEV